MTKNFNTGGLIPVEDIYNANDYRRKARSKPAPSEKKTSLEPMLSIMDAAKLVGVNRKTIDKAINSGELPFYPIGAKARKIKESDLQRWIESKRTIFGSEVN